jgi:hypothetical protein
MRFSLVYDDAQAILAASMSPDNAAEPLRGPDESNADLDISDKTDDLELNETAERLPPVPPWQNNNAM